MTTTVNTSRYLISVFEHNYTPEMYQYLNDSFDEFSNTYPEIEDFRTNVIFYWRGYSITPDSVQKILLGARSVPDGLTMKVFISDGSVH
ncbi:MAG: hypothetical protein OQK95_00145 [Gammaproteobacteria bacterium]|nr:hypothetical protein [Gammaproteobacteria bacterium]